MTASEPNGVFTEQEKKNLSEHVLQCRVENEKYLRSHPEITMVLNEILRQLLARRPNEPVAFVEDFLASNDLKALYQTLMMEQQAAH